MGCTLCSPCGICGRNDSFTVGGTCSICWVLARDLPSFLATSGGLMFARKYIPILDDWVGNKADAWDYDIVLRDNSVDMFLDDDNYWAMSWKQGTMGFGIKSEIHARKAAALFVSLYLRSISASFASKLVTGYLMYLELQES